MGAWVSERWPVCFELFFLAYKSYSFVAASYWSLSRMTSATENDNDTPGPQKTRTSNILAESIKITQKGDSRETKVLKINQYWLVQIDSEWRGKKEKKKKEQKCPHGAVSFVFVALLDSCVPDSKLKMTVWPLLGVHSRWKQTFSLNDSRHRSTSS